MKVVERPLTTEQDGIPGYLACPERAERGPALLLVHQNTGVTDYIWRPRLRRPRNRRLSAARCSIGLAAGSGFFGPRAWVNLFSVPCELKSFSADKHFSCFF